jgi:hypothetical protein
MEGAVAPARLKCLGYKSRALHPLRQIVPASLIALSVFDRTATACPFCGGWGDAGDGLLQTLVIVAVLGFGARAALRALTRKRPGGQDLPAESSPRSRT